MGKKDAVSYTHLDVYKRQLQYYGENYNEAYENLEKEKVDLILEIPPKFEKNIVRETQNKVLVAINAINGTKAGLSGVYLSQILQDYNKNIQTELSPEIVEMQKNAGLQVDSMPVSYTHLDVYKRQQLNFQF